MKKKILLSTLLLCAGMSSAWADNYATSGTGTTTAIAGTDGAAVTLDLSTYDTSASYASNSQFKIKDGPCTDFTIVGDSLVYNISNSKEQKYQISFTAGTQVDNVVIKFIIKKSTEIEYSNEVTLEKNGSWTYSSKKYSMTTTNTISTGVTQFIIKFVSSGNGNTTANIGNVTFTPSTATVYTISATSEDETKGKVNAAATYAEGEEVTLTATPTSALYAFDSWTYTIGNGTEQISKENPLTISNAAGNIVAKASFKDADRQAIPGTISIADGDFTNCEYESANGNIGSGSNGATVDYYVTVSNTGAYSVSVDAAYANNSTVGYKLSLISSDGAENVLGSQTVASTSNWQSYTTYTMTTSSIKAGNYTLRVTLTTDERYTPNIKNIVFKEASATAVTLNDTETFTPKAVENATVTLNRTFVANQWNSLCLPFAMTADQIKAAFGDAKVATMSTNSTSDNVSFTTVTATEANVPYLIFVSSAVSSATIEGVTISDAGTQTTGGDGVQFNGNYTAGKTLASTDYFVYNNNIVKGSNNTMNAFRAYFTSTNSNAKLSLSIDGESVTAIDGIKVSESSNSQAFNLAGQKVSGSYKGIVVKNGKKVIY